MAKCPLRSQLFKSQLRPVKPVVLPARRRWSCLLWKPPLELPPFWRSMGPWTVQLLPVTLCRCSCGWKGRWGSPARRDSAGAPAWSKKADGGGWRDGWGVDLEAAKLGAFFGARLFGLFQHAPVLFISHHFTGNRAALKRNLHWRLPQWSLTPTVRAFPRPRRVDLLLTQLATRADADLVTSRRGRDDWGARTPVIFGENLTYDNVKVE